jgi:N-methylhydantoinase A
VIPRAAEVFSAWGMLMSDLRRDYFVTRLRPLTHEHAGALDDLLAEVTELASAQFADEGIAAPAYLRYGSLRYENQEHTVEVLLPAGSIDAAAVDEIAERFHRSYEREYTYRLDAPVEFVGTHVVATADVGKLAPAPLPRTGRDLASASKGRRQVDFAGGGADTAIYDGDRLEPGMQLCGPAIIETAGGIVVVHPGNEVHVDDYGNLIIAIGS